MTTYDVNTCARGCCHGPTAQADHYRSVVVRPTVTAKTLSEARLGKDLDAYKRLVQSGAKPKGIDGAAVLERDASTAIEIERNHVVKNDRLRREWESAHASAPPPITPDAA